MTTDEPSKRLVMQRVHNRLLESLELASSFDAQREFQRKFPFVNVPAEVICEWSDWEYWRTDPAFTEPAFSPEEQLAVAEFHRVWRSVADVSPGRPDNLEQVIRLPEWSRLREAAERALAVFRVRGRLPEDEEIAD